MDYSKEPKVYTPQVIDDTPFPQEGVLDQTVTQASSNGTYKPTETKEQSFPTKKVAVELLSTSLNTRSKKILSEFQFTKSGAIQVGEYTNGVSGDLRLSPSGITARNTSGITTFAIDGETGDATFAGTIQAGTLISGMVVVGDNNVVINGDERNIIVNDGTNDRVLLGYQLNGF